ncbi:MAG: TolC family protein [Muribaculaceae bacterium]|nr:TolC family protein [Muribaculaceae bacterium]
MINPRLLTGLLCALLSGWGSYAVCQQAQRTVTLQEIFESAESHSAQLRPSFTAEEEAEREINVARNGLLPDINASLSLSYIGDGFTTKRNFTDYQRAPIPHLGTGLSVSVNQPVYTGGAVTASIEMARLKSTASRFATDLNRDDLRLRLTGYYLDIYRYDNLRSVVESNLESALRMLEDMNARFAEGTVLHNDITRYELLVSNLELQIIKIDNTLDILNNNLVVTAGLPASTVIRPDSTLLSSSLPLEGEQAWQDYAQEASPTLRLARTATEISRKAEAITRAGQLPKIGMQAGWSMDGPILVEIPPINRNLSYWYVGVGVSYNLSSIFKTGRELSRSRAAVIKADQQLEATRQNVQMAVRADYIRYLEAYEEFKTQEKSVELALVNYHTVSTRYNEGMALITDLLDAADSRLQAEQRLVDSRINIIYNYYKLLFTTGKI